MSENRRQSILNAASDLMSKFLYYDRKEDEDLPRGSIGEALRNGEVTVDELVALFRTSLEKEMKP